FVFHSSAPVAASTAYAFALPSPKNAASRCPRGVLTRAMLIAERTADPASKNQCTQPVAALSEYTFPPALPTNTRPPAVVACALACRSPGNPNAHFSLSRGRSAAVTPAI